MMKALGIAVIAVAASMIGCIGFRAGYLEETRLWPPVRDPASRKPTLRICLTGNVTWNREPDDPSLRPEAWLRQAREIYVDSGLFSAVRGKAETADLTADVEALHEESGSKFLIYLSLLTLAAVPCTVTEELTWRTTFKDGEGRILGVIEKGERLTTWVQTLLFLPGVIMDPKMAWRETLTDINRSTIHDALERGYLPR